MRPLPAPRFRLTTLLAFSTLAAVLTASALTAHASHVGRRFPSEKKTYTDKVTGLTITALTTDPVSSEAKPYQTHTTWTADSQWIIFRADKAGSGSQAFLVHEKNGDIIQLTDGPTTDTGSLNLSRKTNTLYYLRGGPQRRPAHNAPADAPPPPPATPRELVELALDPLISDALAGKPKAASAYERVVCVLPADLRDSGGFALDADESRAYWGVAWDPERPRAQQPTTRPATPPAGVTGAPNTQGGRLLDQQNTDPAQSREASRKRFEENGKGPGGIRSIDLKTGEIKTVIDVDFRMGHVQTNPWVPGEIIYCHETTGDAPQRMWVVNADGSNNRPLYVETPDEWITHETVATKDEVMFNIMGHLPYLRERPTGVAVINLRTNQMKILGQMEEDTGRRGTGGFWHCNGSSDGKWAVADNFGGDIYLIDRRNGEMMKLTTDHKMRPDHTHPIISPDDKRVLIQSGHFTDGKTLDLLVVDIPEKLLAR
jgi:oligogalacturonide lyase